MGQTVLIVRTGHGDKREDLKNVYLYFFPLFSFFLLQFCSVNFTNEQFSNFSDLFGKSSSLAPEDWAQYVGSFWLSSMVHQTDCLQTLRHEIGKLDQKKNNPKIILSSRDEIGSWSAEVDKRTKTTDSLTMVVVGEGSYLLPQHVYYDKYSLPAHLVTSQALPAHGRHGFPLVYSWFHACHVLPPTFSLPIQIQGGIPIRRKSMIPQWRILFGLEINCICLENF